MGFHHVGQAVLELTSSGDPPALASNVLGLEARTTMPGQFLYFYKIFTPQVIHLPLPHKVLGNRHEPLDLAKNVEVIVNVLEGFLCR